MYSHLANTCTTVSFHKYGWYVRAPRTSLTPPLFLIDVPVPIQEISGHLNMYFSSIYLPLSAIFGLNFGTVPTVWNCFVFIFLPLNNMKNTYVITIYKRSVHAS